MLDSTFDGDGSVTTTFFGTITESAADVAIQSDGKIVAVGTAYDGHDFEYTITRIDADGWLNGRMITDFAEPANDEAHGVAIQGDGRIVVVGGTQSCSSNFTCVWTLARYTSVTPVRTLGATPSSVNFGSTTVGSAPKSASVTMTNTGSVTLEISLADVNGTAAGLSITADSCTGLSIASKATCTVDLSYAPPSAATLAAHLDIESNAEVSPLVVPLQGTAVAPTSGVTWGTNNKAGPAYTWNGGGALARTVESGTQRLHVAYATDRVGGAWADNNGPMPACTTPASSTGSTWSSTPKRLNPSKQHAARLGLAAAGSRVYATSVSQTKWVNYSPTAPRLLYIRVNTNHGSSTAWKSAITLSSTSRRVDYPTIAATGDDVYIAYTDGTTGEIRVARSETEGRTGQRQRSGSRPSPPPRAGAACPRSLQMAPRWSSRGSRTGRHREGPGVDQPWLHLGYSVTIGSKSNGYASAAVLGSRIAIAWTTADDVVVRRRSPEPGGRPRSFRTLTLAGRRCHTEPRSC